MGAHTPGPWSVERGNFDRSRYIAGPDGVAVCRIASNTTPKTMRRERDGVHEANARLIAAAPELLEALKLCARLADLDNRLLTTDAEFPTLGGYVRAAIAKATGAQS